MLKHYIAIFWARNLTTYQVLFFVCHLGQKLFAPQTVLRQWHSSLDPQFIWISPWLGWKPIYVETLISEFFSAKFDNVSSTFFVHQLGQKIFQSQTLLGPWHSSLEPQIIWISSWLGWKPIYVETLYSEFFSAKFDNVSSTFFVYQLSQKIFHSQPVLGPWHSSLEPQIISISSWLGWKPIYVETLYSEFFSAKFDNVSSTFFRIPPRSKKFSLSDCTQTATLLPRPSIHLNKSLTRLKSNLCWNTI